MRPPPTERECTFGLARFRMHFVKDGMRSSHSSRVAVVPIRRIACSYSFQTGSITGWSCVSNMYFVNFE